mmetsp:Transcript_38309/g.114709  ORF Transcript_38309/g.114709 Transcript_38309/m.114709 type:complete len:255 (+) Transcript_38309:483-1247(+)
MDLLPLVNMFPLSLSVICTTSRTQLVLTLKLSSRKVRRDTATRTVTTRKHRESHVPALPRNTSSILTARPRLLCLMRWHSSRMLGVLVTVLLLPVKRTTLLCRLIMIIVLKTRFPRRLKMVSMITTHSVQHAIFLVLSLTVHLTALRRNVTIVEMKPMLPLLILDVFLTVPPLHVVTTSLSFEWNMTCVLMMLCQNSVRTDFMIWRSHVPSSFVILRVLRRLFQFVRRRIWSRSQRMRVVLLPAQLPSLLPLLP